MTKNTCCIPNCNRLTESRICTIHWFGTPIALRQRWWKETNFSKLPPSPDLIAEFVAVQKQKPLRQ